MEEETKTLCEIYELIRKEIHHEYTNMANRLNWLISGEAFLFSAYILGIPRDKKTPFSFESSLYHPMIPILGLALAAVIYVSCLGAQFRIRDFRGKQKIIADKMDKGELTKYAYQPQNDVAMIFGMFPTVMIPPLFFMAWLNVWGLPISIMINTFLISIMLSIAIWCQGLGTKIIENGSNRNQVK